jgi:hypothetical protein
MSDTASYHHGFNGEATSGRLVANHAGGAISLDEIVPGVSPAPVATMPSRVGFFGPPPMLCIDTNADPLVIHARDGGVLLRLGPNGEFEGAIEDMGEAAETFVRAVREMLGGGAGG